MLYNTHTNRSSCEWAPKWNQGNNSGRAQCLLCWLLVYRYHEMKCTFQDLALSWTVALTNIITYDKKNCKQFFATPCTYDDYSYIFQWTVLVHLLSAPDDSTALWVYLFESETCYMLSKQKLCNIYCLT